jgi:hypothetical protein
MNSTSKVALTWLEVCLIVLLVAIGLGIWAYVEKQVDDSASATEPREEEFQIREGVRAAESELAAAKDEVTALRTKLMEQWLEKARETATAESLGEAFPQVHKLLTTISSVQIERVQEGARTWSEIEVNRRFLAQLDADLAALIEQNADLNLALAVQTPPSEKTAVSKDYLVTQAQLGTNKIQLEQTQKKLAEARLEVPQLRASFDKVIRGWSEGEKFISENPGLVNLPPEVWQNEASIAKRKASDLFAKALSSELQIRKTEVLNNSRALLAAERAASKALKEATKNWVKQKRWKTLGFSCLWLAVPFLVVLGVREVATKFSAADFNGNVVLGSAMAALAVLYAYQVGQLLCGAAIALVLLLVIATIGSGRRTKPEISTPTPAAPVAATTAASALKNTP